MNVAEKIFALVDAKYKEQQMFADVIGVTHSIVSEWRRGKSKSYMKHLPEIAAALGVTTSDLLGEEKHTPAVEGGDVSDDFYKLLSRLSPEQRERAANILRQVFPDAAK